MASRVGAISTGDVGRFVTEQRRQREREDADRAKKLTAEPVKPQRPTFELNYTISNNGDGSVSLRLHRSATRALAADEAEPEPFAEPTAGSLRFRVHTDGATIEVDEGRGTWVKLAPAGGAEG